MNDDTRRAFLGHLAQGATALAGSPGLTGLTCLSLRGTKVGPKGTAALAASPHLSRLLTLHLAHNPVGPNGVRALAASRTLARLTTLDLACGQRWTMHDGRGAGVLF